MTKAKRRKPQSGTTRTTTWRPSRDVVAQRLGDDLMLVQLATDRIYSLNGTAARLWELVSTGLSADAIETRLGREFAVEPARLRRDVTRILASFAKNDLVVERAPRRAK